MYGILCILECKNEKTVKKYLKDEGDILLIKNLDTAKDLTRWYNNTHSTDFDGIKYHFKTVDYTTGNYVN